VGGFDRSPKRHENVAVVDRMAQTWGWFLSPQEVPENFLALVSGDCQQHSEIG
jgi:hypothetical protein